MRRLLQSRCRAEEVMFLLKSPAFSKNAQVWPGTISYRVAGIADSKGMLRHLRRSEVENSDGPGEDIISHDKASAAFERVACVPRVCHIVIESNVDSQIGVMCDSSELRYKARNTMQPFVIKYIKAISKKLYRSQHCH